MEIPRCKAIGFLESQQNDTFKKIHAIDQNLLEKEVSQDKPAPKPMSLEDKSKFLVKNKNQCMYKPRKNDIGLATNGKYRIDLEDKEPTYTKQFPIPDARRGEKETQVKYWLKMGLIQPSRSR
jgi:hypothetical protein